jgi:HK97 family phage prohead protease
MPMIQFKSTPAVIKDLSVSDRTVTGYYATFTQSFDYDTDVFRAGAYDKTIAEWGPDGKNKIVHLYQHDTTKPLAKPKVLKADGTGVYFESQFATTSWGDDVLKLYEAGIINEHSVGFEILRANPINIDGKVGQEITEVRMWEGSTVTFGANEDTPFMGFKSLTRPQMADRINKLMKAIRNGTFTDETFHLLEIELAHIAGHLANPPEVVSAPDEKSTQNQIAPDELTQIFDQFTLKTHSWKLKNS